MFNSCPSLTSFYRFVMQGSRVCRTRTLRLECVQFTQDGSLRQRRDNNSCVPRPLACPFVSVGGGECFFFFCLRELNAKVFVSP